MVNNYHTSLFKKGILLPLNFPLNENKEINNLIEIRILIIQFKIKLKNKWLESFFEEIN